MELDQLTSPDLLMDRATELKSCLHSLIPLFSYRRFCLRSLSDLGPTNSLGPMRRAEWRRQW